MAHEDEKFEGRMHGPQDDPDSKDSIWMRLVYMILIWFMLQISFTVLGVVTLIQFVVTLLQKGEPNERLAEFGESLGIWMAKAARFMVAASEVKPWPWTELD